METIRRTPQAQDRLTKLRRIREQIQEQKKRLQASGAPRSETLEIERLLEITERQIEKVERAR